MARIDVADDTKSWKPVINNEHQWLQVDLPAEQIITGVVVSGEADSESFVSRFTVQYSLDGISFEDILTEDGYRQVTYKKISLSICFKSPMSMIVSVWTVFNFYSSMQKLMFPCRVTLRDLFHHRLWQSYVFAVLFCQYLSPWNPDSWLTYHNLSFHGQVFRGNDDATSTKTVFFESEIKALQIRLLPVEWTNDIALSFELLGCKGLHKYLLPLVVIICWIKEQITS